MLRKKSAHDDPKVTVAMVTCNSEAYVAEAIESVLAQEFRDFELLICDDGSTDRTWEVVGSYRDRRIRAVRNDANLGEYPNRNRALALAHGRYLTYLDGDDYLYPHGLGFMVKMMEAFPRAAFAAAQEPSEKFIYPVELTPHQFYSCLFLGPVVVGANFTQLIFRTERLRAARGFDPRFASGDMHIQFRMGMRENCLLINGSLAWWRRRPGQASEGLRRGRSGIAELTRYGCEFLDDADCPLDAGEKRLARANLSRLMLRSAVKVVLAGHPLRALRILERSGLGLADCRHLFAPYRRPYLADVSGANPIRVRMPAAVPAAIEPSHAVVSARFDAAPASVRRPLPAPRFRPRRKDVTHAI